MHLHHCHVNGCSIESGFESIGTVFERGASSCLLAAWLVLGHAVVAVASDPQAIRFSIPTQGLASALDGFSEQSGLQVVYSHDLIDGRRAPTVSGLMQIGEALDCLLAGSTLHWKYVDHHTIVVEREASSSRTVSRSSARDEPATVMEAGRDIAALEHVIIEERGEDPVGVLPLEPIDSVFGFPRSLLETPRSASVLGDELMTFYGIESATDVAKVSPATYTASIFGINGNVNVRGMNGDTYFRGIKRLENTQLFPSPVTAMSRLEVVRGPPSPLYGPGKVGGYSNFVPKSARASTGKYLEDPTGQLMLTAGSYDKKGISAEIGGPFSLQGKPGGYYVYLNAEDSGTYWDNVPFEQYIAQSSFDYQLADSVRIEFGQMYQFWGGTELAGWNRITQELIDTGIYNAGEVSVNMDLNGDGLVSTAEVDSFGPLLLSFPAATASTDVAAALGQGWAIDPGSVRQVRISRQATAQSEEDDGEANVHLAYFDVIVEMPNGSSLTSKSYFETMDRFKWTRASAFGQDTHSRVFEQKLLYETALFRRSHLQADLALSGMFRHYDTLNRTGSKYNDLVNRADLSRPFNPSNRFAVPNLEPELAPWNTGLASVYDTYGFGALLDATMGRTSMIMGARFDWVDIESRIPDNVLTTPGLQAEGQDEGPSWTVSASYEVLDRVRPYLTFARQQTLIYGIDGGVGINIVPDALNTSELREVGVKASLFGDTLFGSLAAYRQTRRSFSGETTQVPSTLSRGWEVEARWAPNKRFSLSAGGPGRKRRMCRRALPRRPSIQVSSVCLMFTSEGGCW